MLYDWLFLRDTFANFPQISYGQNPSSNQSCEMSFLSQTFLTDLLLLSPTLYGASLAGTEVEVEVGNFVK